MIELPPFDALALSLHHSPGVHAILVGSGLSRAAGIPTGWEITLDLIRRLAALDGIAEHEDWATWYRDKYGKEPSYSEILDALASTQAERRSILHGYIEPAEGEEARRPTKAHHAIAQLVASGAVRVIITTNFDRLIENALREAGIEPTVIAGDDAITGATPLVHAKCTVIKVHGDYLDARIKNTDSELEGYSPAMDMLLDQVFDNFGLLSVGWSGEWDTALRSAILRAPSRRYPFYWASRGKVGGLAQDLLDQRGGRSFAIADADSFFVKLAETLEALTQANRPHPQSIEMAVALAKRYCRDDKFSMEWTEFLHAEVDKIAKFVNGPEYPTARPTDQSLNELVSRFISLSEIIRRACLICGRWGTREANKSVINAIRSVSFQNSPQSGYTWLINLRKTAAMMCFYWNSIGLISREDWVGISSLFHAETVADGKPIQIISILPPTTFESVDWKFLTGFERNYTPASDFLRQMIESEIRDIAVSPDEIDALFDSCEALISLEFAADRMKHMAGTGLWFWTPAGRFVWKRSRLSGEALFGQFDDLAADHPILTAGLIGGAPASSAEIIKATREHFGKAASSWF